MLSDRPSPDIVKQILEQLPVKEAYRDVASPAAKQVGLVLEDIAKAVRLALAPIQYAGHLQDRYSRFLADAVAKVPTETLDVPPPQILGPVLNGVRYEPEGTAIEQMFSELLARSMNRDRSFEAHPAFPTIISQLSEDEAALIELISPDGFILENIIHTDFINSKQAIAISEIPKKIVNEKYLWMYFEHLTNLGLVLETPAGPSFQPQPNIHHFPMKKHLSAFGVVFAGAVGLRES